MTTVLIIEDDPDARLLLSDLLTAHGSTVVSVADGASGLAILDDGLVPDVILSDLMLPGVLGTSVLEYVNARPALCNTRTALVTGSPEHAPADATVFTKPVKIADLLAFVDT